MLCTKFCSLSWHRQCLFSALAAGGLLAVALISQFGFGLHPCQMCWWQRYPYIAIVVIGMAGACSKTPANVARIIAAVCILLFAVDAGIAIYHAGVEWGIFTGFTSCSNGDSGAPMSIEEMRAQIMGAPLVACNQAPFYFLGLSMAGWNAVAAMCMTLLGAVLWKKGRPL